MMSGERSQRLPLILSNAGQRGMIASFFRLFGRQLGMFSLFVEGLYGS